MSDYIKREDAIKAIDEHLSSMLDGAEISALSKELYGLGHAHCKDVIYSLPAAPVREVVKGKWKVAPYPDRQLGFGTWCSHCHGWAVMIGSWPNQHLMLSDWCPNCGADMRTEEDGFTRELRRREIKKKQGGPT